MHVADIAAYIQKESTTIPKVEALIDACKLQSEDIASLASSVPQNCRVAAAPAGPRTTTIPVLGNVSNTLRAGEGGTRRGGGSSGTLPLGKAPEGWRADPSLDPGTHSTMRLMGDHQVSWCTRSGAGSLLFSSSFSSNTSRCVQMRTGAPGARRLPGGTSPRPSSAAWGAT